MYTEATLVNVIKTIYEWHEETHNMPIALKLISSNTDKVFSITVDGKRYYSVDGELTILNTTEQYYKLQASLKANVDTVYINCQAFQAQHGVRMLLSQIINVNTVKRVIVDKYEDSIFDLSDIIGTDVDYYILPHKSIKNIVGVLNPSVRNLILNIKYCKITSMQSMFANTNIESIQFEMNLGGVTNVASCFENCKKLKSVQMFDLYSTTNFQRCFYGCEKLSTLNRLNMNNATNVTDMFYMCMSLELFDGFTRLSQSIDLSDCSILGRYGVSAVVSDVCDVKNKTIKLHRNTYNELVTLEKKHLSEHGWTIITETPKYAHFDGNCIFDLHVIPTTATSFEIMFEGDLSDFGKLIGVKDKTDFSLLSQQAHNPLYNITLPLFHMHGGNRLFDTTQNTYKYLGAYQHNMYRIRLFRNKMYIYYNENEYDEYLVEKPSAIFDISKSAYLGNINGTDTQNGFIGKFHFLKVFKNEKITDFYVPAIKEGYVVLYNKLKNIYMYPIKGVLTAESVYTEYKNNREYKNFNIQSDSFVMQYDNEYNNILNEESIYDFTVGKSVTDIDISEVNVTNPNCNEMFADCTQLTQVAGLRFSDVRFTDNMFCGCDVLQHIYGIIDGRKLLSTYNALRGCTSLVSFNGFKNIKCSIDMGDCVSLSYESLVNIIDNLGVCEIPTTIRLNISLMNSIRIENKTLHDYIYTICALKNWVVVTSNMLMPYKAIQMKSIENEQQSNAIKTDIFLNDNSISVSVMTMNDGYWYMGSRDGISNELSTNKFIVKVSLESENTFTDITCGNSSVRTNIGINKQHISNIKTPSYTTSYPLFIGAINSCGTPVGNTLTNLSVVMRVIRFSIIDTHNRVIAVYEVYGNEDEFGFINIIDGTKYPSPSSNEYIDDINNAAQGLMLFFGSMQNHKITVNDEMLPSGTYKLYYVDKRNKKVNGVMPIMTISKD